MKRPISWHEECLINRRKAYERKMLDLINMQKSVGRDQIELAILIHQIEQAKKKKKDGFDSEKFLVSRAKHRTIVSGNFTLPDRWLQ
jgi:hypothetical protein